jgi:hypothetical protein
MLTLVSGPIHPFLENAFRDHVRERTSKNPLSPVAVVAPSARLLERLQFLLVESEL